jgi:quaternary ammonium compound-resistance protein SugE
VRPLALFAVAAVLYAVGGIFMKMSVGVTRAWPTLGFLTLFMCGAIVQAIGMRNSDLGPSYVMVLGAEAVAAILLGIIFLREGYTLSRIAAVVVILLGIAWLRLQ